MRAELEALRVKVTTLGRSAFLGSVPAGETVPPAYYLIELAGGGRPDDRPVSEATSAWDLPVRVKSVGQTPEQALIYLDAARALLVPLGRVAPLVVTGRGAWLRFERHEADYLDRDAGPTAFISLDAYTLVSVPADDES